MATSPNFPDCFYRVTVKGMCVRDGKLLLVRESEKLSGANWELPGGGLDFGEDIGTAFRREIKEEMGLSVLKMSRTPVYVWPRKVERRRKMDWFYALVVCYRVEFEDLNFTPSEECLEVRFFEKEELNDLKLGLQLDNLPEVFRPEDFNEPF